MWHGRLQAGATSRASFMKVWPLSCHNLNWGPGLGSIPSWVRSRIHVEDGGLNKLLVALLEHNMCAVGESGSPVLSVCPEFPGFVSCCNLIKEPESKGHVYILQLSSISRLYLGGMGAFQCWTAARPTSNDATGRLALLCKKQICRSKWGGYSLTSLC